MKFIRDFSKFRESRINEALESGQFLTYHRTRLVEQSYVIDKEVNPNVNFYQQFAENMIVGIDKEQPEYTQRLKKNIKLLSDMNPNIKLDDRGFPIVKIGDKIVTSDPRIISQGFRAGAGDFYGVGVYTCYEFDDQLRDFDNDGKVDMAFYGQNIVEFKVENSGKFLILDMNEGNNQAKKVWGPKHTLIDQLKKIMGGKFLNFYNKNKELIDGFNEILVKTKYTKPDGQIEELKRDEQGRFLTAPIGKDLCEMPGFISLVDGISFTGNNDGRVLVIYEADLAKPTRYTSDDGRTWTPMAKLDYQYERVRVGNKEILQCKIIDNDKELLQIDPERSDSMMWLSSLDLPEIFKDKEKTVKLFSQMKIDSLSKKYLDKMIDDISTNKTQVLENIIKRMNELPITDLKINQDRIGIYLSNFVYFLRKFIDKVGQSANILSEKINSICNYLSQNLDKVSIPLDMILYLYNNVDERYKDTFQELFKRSDELYSDKINYDDDGYLNLLKGLTESSNQLTNIKIEEALDKFIKRLLGGEIEFFGEMFISGTSDFRLSSYSIGPFKKVQLLLSTDFENLGQKYFDAYCQILSKYLKAFLKFSISTNFKEVEFFRVEFFESQRTEINRSSSNVLTKLLESSDKLNNDSIGVLSDAVFLYLVGMKEENIGMGSKTGQKFVVEKIEGTNIVKVLKDKLLKLKNGQNVSIADTDTKLNDYQYSKCLNKISKYIKLEDDFLPELNYSDISDTIFKAMKGFGVDEESLIYQFSRLRNSKDLDKLKSAFGKRRGSLGGEYDLDYWVKDELKSRDLDKLNNILKEKGINYQF